MNVVDSFVDEAFNEITTIMVCVGSVNWGVFVGIASIPFAS